MMEQSWAETLPQHTKKADAHNQAMHDKQLKHIITHDYLTALPNNILLKDRLQQSLAHAQRSKTSVAVICINIEDFKLINEQYSYEIGDCLLRDIAQRLKACIRQSDTVARMGGDAFMVVVDQIHHIDDVHEVAQKVLISLCTGFLLQRHKIKTACSIGISDWVSNRRSISDYSHAVDIAKSAALMLKQADTAMHQATQAGRNRIVFFKPEPIGQSDEVLQSI